MPGLSDGRDRREYWEKRVGPYLGTRDEVCAVAATGLPPVFARFVHWLEKRTLLKATEFLPRRGRLLEVGCGYGRWFALWAHRGSPFVGVDFTLPLLRRAAENRPGSLLVAADVRQLSFHSAAFDGICSVKTLQCLPHEERARALGELFRVASRGSPIILFEKIRGRDGSPPELWIRWASEHGARLVAWFGNEFAPLDRGFHVFRRLVARRFEKPGGNSENPETGFEAGPVQPLRVRHAGLYRVFLAVRTALLGASWVLEPLVEKFLPAPWALHGLFVFRKG